MAIKVKKLTPEEIHKIARRPLPAINLIVSQYLCAGNKIFRESTNQVTNETNSPNNLE